MKYPLRRNYHWPRARQHWMRDILEWRKINREMIARLDTNLQGVYNG